jgi:hypothetical protein
LIPCEHMGPLFACALGQTGSMQASSEGVANRHRQSVLWVAAGGRFGVLMPLHDHTVLRVRSDIVANLNRSVLQLNGKDQWDPPPAAASLGADVVVHF